MYPRIHVKDVDESHLMQYATVYSDGSVELTGKIIQIVTGRTTQRDNASTREIHYYESKTVVMLNSDGLTARVVHEDAGTFNFWKAV